MQLHILAGGLLNQTMMTFSCKRIRNKKGGERRAPFLQRAKKLLQYIRSYSRSFAFGAFFMAYPAFNVYSLGFFITFPGTRKAELQASDADWEPQKIWRLQATDTMKSRERTYLCEGANATKAIHVLYDFVYQKLFSKVSKGFQRFSKVQEGFKWFWEASQVTFLNLSEPFRTF